MVCYFRCPSGFPAFGGAAIGLHESRALGCHLVEARGFDQLLSVAAEVALGDIVAEDEDEIGRARSAAMAWEEDSSAVRMIEMN